VTRLLAVIAWAAAMLATLGAATLSVHLMAYSALVGAVAALAWGYAKAVETRRAARWERGRAQVWARRDGKGSPIVSEVTHRPLRAFTVIEGGKQAVWPNEAGAIE
jgi:hypothetical protein